MSQECKPSFSLEQTSGNIIRGEISRRPSISSFPFEACFPENSTPELSRLSISAVELYNQHEQYLLRGCIPLLDEALRGDWEAGDGFLSDNRLAVLARITRKMENALHIAAGEGHREFVKELVKMMTPDDLEMWREVGNTALCFATASGVREIAKAMIDKNLKLALIRGTNEAMPLYIAALLGKQDMVWIESTSLPPPLVPISLVSASTLVLL